MSRSKRRGRNKLNHYGNANVLTTSQRKDLYGKKSRPVPGGVIRTRRLSKYMGSLITPGNRREYEAKQAEMFIERYVADVEKKRLEIEKQENKNSEEIRVEVDRFNEKQVDEASLRSLANRFARYQSYKEMAHFKAWKSGKEFYIYKNKPFKVITEAFLKKSTSVTEIETV